MNEAVVEHNNKTQKMFQQSVHKAYMYTIQYMKYWDVTQILTEDRCFGMLKVFLHGNMCLG